MTTKQRLSLIFIAIGIALWCDLFVYDGFISWSVPCWLSIYDGPQMFAYGFPFPYSADALYTSGARNTLFHVFVLDLCLMSGLIYVFLRWISRRFQLNLNSRWWLSLIIPAGFVMVLYLLGFWMAVRGDAHFWDVNFKWHYRDLFLGVDERFNFWHLRPVFGEAVDLCLNSK